MSSSFEEARVARNTKLAIIGGSLATLLLLGMEAWREHYAGEWRSHQAAYASALTPEFRDAFQVGLKQAFLPELGRVDRCRTCHVGIEDPAMAGQDQPLGAHPNDLLTHHPAEDFGCTICHQGQGRAVRLPDAHGEVPHWEEPLVRGPLVYASCGRCHVENSPFGELSEHFGGRVADSEIHQGGLAREIPGAQLINEGKRLFVAMGCLGCHVYRGRGDAQGRDLTHIGDKDAHGYDFSHLPPDAERTPVGWLTEHFLDPAAVSPGSVMPDMGLSRDQAFALAAYMLSLKSQTLPARFLAASATPSGEPVTGEQLYGMFCIACHGKDLVASQVPAIRTPSLSNEDLLAVASDEYFESIISRGRSGTDMPAWLSGRGGLTSDQIRRIVAYIRSYQPDRADIASITATRGDPEVGRALYRGRCANCHGRKGEGGIGTALRARNWLMMASDELLARTIVEGRPESGMPSWRSLSSQAVSDIIAFVKSWRGTGADTAEIAAHLEAGADATMGATLYRARCAACHGREGQGAIGPSLNSAAFLSIVSDEFLMHAIRDGRPGTAMPSWTDLTPADVGDLIAHVRSFADTERRRPVALVTQGDPDNGGLLYDVACTSCHGQQGSGGTGPQLANPVFLAHVSDGYLYETIARGRSGTPMRGFLKGGAGATSGVADFSPSQIADLVAYLRNLRFRPVTPESVRPVLGNSVRGRHIYMTRGACVSCHGEHGEGGVGSALGNPSFHDQATEGFVLGTLVLGREGTEMRSFSSGGIADLGTEDLMDVAAFVRTLPPRAPAGSASWRTFLAAGPTHVGRQLYVSYCASCHGEAGKGGYAPDLNNPEFLSAASDGFLIATIAMGRGGTPMRAFGPAGFGMATLTAEEIRNIVGYMRSWQQPAAGTANEDSNTR